MNLADAQEILNKHCKSRADNDSNEISQNWYKLKYRHSLMVYQAMEELINNDSAFMKLPETHKEKLLIVAVLHDIGRFYQMHDGVLDKVKHGTLGAEILTREIADDYILYLISHHDDKNDALILQNRAFPQDELYRDWQAIRDADMLANLKMMKEDNDIYAIRDAADRKNFEPVINREMLNSVLEKKGFDIKNVTTTYDSWAIRICSINMLYFPYSQNICAENKILPFLYEYIDLLKKQSEQYGFDDFSLLNTQQEQIKAKYQAV